MKFRKYIQEAEEPVASGFDVRDIEGETLDNENFRKVLYTGSNLQLVLMSLEPNEDIGSEVHEKIDQFFRIDSGEGKVVIDDKDEYPIKDGSSIVINAGTRHNIVNTSSEKKLKLYSVYAPPQHPEGTVHKTKEDAMKGEE